MNRTARREIRCVAAAIMFIAVAGRVVAQEAASVSATLSVARTNVFTREVFPATLTIVSSGVELGQNFGLDGLPNQGQVQFGAFREMPIQRERRGDQTVEVRRFTSDAQAGAPGVITLRLVLQTWVLARRWGLLGPFTQEVRQAVPVQPLTLTVLALPEAGRPSDFSGAVGQFTMEATASPTNVAAGDLVQVVMHLRGTGALEGVRPPRVAADAGFKVYEPLMVGQDGDAGWRVEQTVIPQATNAAAIPAVTFAYFDPRAARYNRLSRGPFPLVFHARAAAAAFVPYRPAKTAGESGLTVSASEPAPARRIAWSGYAAAGYWAVVLAVAVVLGNRGRRGIMLAVLWSAVSVPVFLGMASAVRAHARHAAGTALLREERARIAPAFSALETFVLPSGTVVRVVGAHEAWCKVAADDKAGWIPADALKKAP